MDIEPTAFRTLFDLSGASHSSLGLEVGFFFGGSDFALVSRNSGCDIAACDLDIENPQRTAEK